MNHPQTTEYLTLRVSGELKTRLRELAKELNVPLSLLSRDILARYSDFDIDNLSKVIKLTTRYRTSYIDILRRNTNLENEIMQEIEREKGLRDLSSDFQGRGPSYLMEEGKQELAGVPLAKPRLACEAKENARAKL